MAEHDPHHRLDSSTSREQSRVPVHQTRVIQAMQSLIAFVTWCYDCRDFLVLQIMGFYMPRNALKQHLLITCGLNLVPVAHCIHIRLANCRALPIEKPWTRYRREKSFESKPPAQAYLSLFNLCCPNFTAIC